MTPPLVPAILGDGHRFGHQIPKKVTEGHCDQSHVPLCMLFSKCHSVNSTNSFLTRAQTCVICFFTGFIFRMHFDSSFWCTKGANTFDHPFCQKKVAPLLVTHSTKQTWSFSMPHWSHFATAQLFPNIIESKLSMNSLTPNLDPLVCNRPPVTPANPADTNA